MKKWLDFSKIKINLFKKTLAKNEELNQKQND